MNCDSEMLPDKETLVMGGELTIKRAGALCVDLQNALKKVQHIELAVEAVKEVDLTFLQLLCSAHRTAVNMGKTLAFRGMIPDILKKSAEDNGYARPHGCVLDSTNTCLWMMK